ncbi:transposon Ty3-G Gag-Pol polyprotein [Trichonephila clavipes]|nr:transposon Ty3-G Gag-Pol polyprotein [Trichonephila clavipes]
MRSALKDDINPTCAQLVYGTTLRLLSDLVTSDSINQTANFTYVTSLIQTMRSLNPVSTAQHGTQNIYINPSLKTCSHIFLRSDKVNPPLTPPYTGPHLVISRNDKNFIIDLNGKQSTVSVDRIKPAYLLADVTDHSDLVQTQTLIEKPVTAAPNPSIPHTTRYGQEYLCPALIPNFKVVQGVACLVRWFLTQNRKVNEQKIHLKFCLKLGKTPKETYAMLVRVSEDQALSIKCVYEWFARFPESRESVSDNSHSGRLVISVSDENIEKVR